MKGVPAGRVFGTPLRLDSSVLVIAWLPSSSFVRSGRGDQRVLVTAGERLVGIVSPSDVTRAIERTEVARAA